MSRMPQLPRRLYVYVATITVLALAMTVVVFRTTPTPTARDWTAVLIFGSLAAVATLLKYRSYSDRTGATMALLPLMSACVLAPNGASMLVVIAVETISEVVVEREVVKKVFNIAHHTLAIAIALTLYRMAGGESLHDFTVSSVIPFAVFYTSAKLLDKFFVSIVLGIVTNRPWHREFYRMQGTLVFEMLGMPMAFLFALAYVFVPPMLTVLFALPLIALRQVYKQHADLVKSHEELLQVMVGAIEARDPYTSGHSRRVARYAQTIATIAGIHERLVQRIAMAAMLHDVGKIHEEFAPILRKPDRLTGEEFAIMQTHAAKGATLVAKATSLADLVPAVRHHHERWDGAGYPDRLVARTIPLTARVIALADTIDAMTTSRPYRGALTADEVFIEIEAESGRQFDPGLVVHVLSTTGRAVLGRLLEEERAVAHEVLEIAGWMAA
jgi:HD-GYP domain-containing protein (c-di-GMP phosphodiesterase class II)